MNAHILSVTAIDGEVIPACPDEAVSDRALQPVIEDFRQFEYGGIPYNLFVPRNYDRDWLFSCRKAAK